MYALCAEMPEEGNRDGLMTKLTPPRVIALGYIILIFLGSILLMLPISVRSGDISFVDSLFTVTSAISTTGLIVVDTGSYFTPFGQLVILALIQIGGLGYMALTTLLALILGKKIGLKERLLIKESLGTFSLHGVVKITKVILVFTLIVEAMGAVLLSFKFATYMDPLKAIYSGIFHSISAFCTAGFSLFPNNLENFKTDPTIALTVTFLTIIGGIGFMVVMDVYEKIKKRDNRFSLHTKLVLIITTILICGGTIAIFTIEYSNSDTLGVLSLPGKLLDSLFHIASAQGTAGFNVLPMDKLHDSTLFITMLLMFIGASPGGTGGGIKTTTFVILLMAAVAMLRREENINLFYRRIPIETVYKALTVVVLALTLVFTITIIMLVTEGKGITKVLFEVISAFGTVGLSVNFTQELSPVGRLLIIITMFVGRVGILTLGIALAQRQRKAIYSYPEEKVMIG